MRNFSRVGVLRFLEQSLGRVEDGGWFLIRKKQTNFKSRLCMNLNGKMKGVRVCHVFIIDDRQ